MAVYPRRGRRGEILSYVCKYPVEKVGGKIRYGHETFSTKKLAARHYHQKYDEYEKRKHLGIRFKDPRKQRTFGELVEWFLELPAVKAKKSYHDIRGRALALKRHFGGFMASEILPATVEAYQQSRLHQHVRRGKSMVCVHTVSRATVNRELAVMRRIYNVAMRNDLVERNPVAQVEMLSEKSKRERVISTEEYQKLLLEIAPHAANLVKVLYWTGMRYSEAVGLTWDRVDMKRGLVYLEDEDVKTEKKRVVPFMHPEVREVFENLRQWRFREPRVFTHNGKPISSIRSAFENACERAGISDFRIHDLRHCARVTFRRAGIHPAVSMAIMGHSSVEMHHWYDTVEDIDLTEAVEKVCATFVLRGHEDNRAGSHKTAI